MSYNSFFCGPIQTDYLNFGPLSELLNVRSRVSAIKRHRPMSIQQFTWLFNEFFPPFHVKGQTEVHKVYSKAFFQSGSESLLLGIFAKRID